MKIIKSRQELRELLEPFRQANLTIGFVPTMGALHEGHFSLIRQSKKENGLTICSIFVNPTQFTDPRDLELYPRPIEHDIKMLENAETDFLFHPEAAEMYAADEYWSLDLQGLDQVMEGTFRPGHFQGVTQIVSKFFELILPTRAYFGQKDYQQFRVISKMVEIRKLSVVLVKCPIIREDDGLAMSSRNIQLSCTMRQASVNISKALFRAVEDSFTLSVDETIDHAVFNIGKNGLLELEYFNIVDALTLQPVRTWGDSDEILALTAVKAGKTRLIDNQYLRPLE